MEYKKKGGRRSRRDELMPEIIQLYYVKNLTMREVSEKIGEKSKTIQKWLAIFASENKEKLENMAKKSTLPASAHVQCDAEEIRRLREENRRLSKELKYEKMTTLALNTMIDVAEEMFEIPIRKKAGTKP